MRARLVKLRMCEVKRVTQYTFLSSPSEGINCVRAVPKRPCVIFMAFSCPSVVLGRLIKEKKEKMEKIAVWLISVYASSSVF